jgi:hypothetical protein
MSWAECRACGSIFSSDAEFDRHRVGDYDVEPPDPEARRCLTQAEMADGDPRRRDGSAALWRRNSRGRWTTRPERPFPQYQTHQDRPWGAG